jgi:RNA polymerase primary sigma factor
MTPESNEITAPVDKAGDIAIEEAMESALSSLWDRERQVVKLRFGIGYERGYTLKEVGAHFGITGERIRQIESKALRKLGHHSKAGRFLDILQQGGWKIQ